MPLLYSIFRKYSIKYVCTRHLSYKYSALLQPVFKISNFTINQRLLQSHSHAKFLWSNLPCHPKLFSRRYLSSRIFHCCHLSSSPETSKSEEIIKRLILIPESKLNQLNIINSSDILNTIKELEIHKDFITDSDLRKLFLLSHEATRRDFLANEDFINGLWNLSQHIGFRFTCDHLSVLLSICSLTSCYGKCKDIWKKMEDLELKMNQEIAEVLVANLSYLGDSEATERVLKIMKSLNLSISENIFCSLLILNGVNGDFDGLKKVLLDMESAKIPPTINSHYSWLVALIACAEWNEAKIAVENIKNSEVKVTPRQYLNIILSSVHNEKAFGTSEFLQYILDSKKDIAGDIDLKPVILHLLHSDFPSIAVRILSTQESYLRTPHIIGKEAVFIQELVKSKHDVNTIVQLCNEIVWQNISTNGLQIALEASLVEQRNDLAWNLLQALKENDSPIREHFFWPLLAQKSPECNKIEKTVHVLKGMQNFNVAPTFETLQKFVIPNFDTSPEITLQILSKAGLSKTKVITPLLSVLISNGKLFDAIEVAESCNVPVDVETLLPSLASSYLKAPSESLKMFQTLLSKSNKEDSIKKKFIQLFIFNILRISKKKLKDPELKSLVKTFPEACHSYEQETGGKTEAPISRPRFLMKNQEGGNPPHPNEMSLEDLESHLIELRAKNMNTRGVLRKLLLSYSASENREKLANVVQDLKAIEGEFSPGMLSSVLYKNVLASDADGALENYFLLRYEFPHFRIDSYKVVDLCNLLVRVNRFSESVSVLKEYITSTPKNFHRKNTFIRNCHKLLNDCANYECYASTREMCSLLLTGGLADPSPIILGPLIKARLLSQDVVGAVQEAEELYATHGVLPMRVEIIIELIRRRKEEGSKVHKLIERMVNLISSARGIKQAKQDIFYATLENGDEEEAARVLQEIDKELVPARIRRLCDFLVRHEKIDPLLLMLTISESSQNIDRNYICESLLNIYSVHLNREAAMQLFSKMQEYGLRPSPLFLEKLSKLSGSAGKTQKETPS